MATFNKSLSPREVTVHLVLHIKPRIRKDSIMSEENTEQVVETPAEATEGKTFTQEELNQIVQRRVAKFADYDDLKAKVEELTNSSEEAMGQAIEKAREEARTEVLTIANTRIVKSETRALAAELGFIYPTDAHLYIDVSEVPVDNDGEPDVDKIKELLSKVAEERPALVRSAESSPTQVDAGIGVTGTGRKKSTAQLFADSVS
jgi:hypothetical protein